MGGFKVKKDCMICNRIKMIEEGTNKYLVAELGTGYVVIGDHQYFEGYSLFLCKEHKHELHELDKEYKEKFLVEMSLVGEAVQRAFKADKINYELLGNECSHMHWHIFPRRLTEQNPTYPVWWTPEEIMYSPNVRPEESKLEDLKNKLKSELNKIL
jgi:diadenosine tetraphosphate (Ap4A) HIT family hydrolase